MRFSFQQAILQCIGLIFAGPNIGAGCRLLQIITRIWDERNRALGRTEKYA